MKAYGTKKVLTAVLVMVMLAFAVTTSVAAYTDYNVRVEIDGVQVNFVNQNPIIVNERTLVPVRGVFEHMGFEVSWDADARKVTLQDSDYTVVITIGSAEFTTNGASHRLPVYAQIINDFTMLPIRPVMESIGMNVEWDGVAGTVIVTSAAEQAPPVEAPPTEEPPVEEPPEEEPEAPLEEEYLEADSDNYITIRDMQIPINVTVLDLDFLELTNEEIEPLRYMTALVELNLEGNNITDLLPLVGLTNLEVLFLYGNSGLSDVGPLAGLSLVELDLGFTNVTDLSPLAGMANLEWLLLDGNSELNDISYLVGLTSLIFVDLSATAVTDWDAVEHVVDVLGRQ